ncbi:PLP-dependent aminotransferase family protein [Actinopolymorpha sp. NPDC004070]|uniref:aminotransferase-like domain-containing protein n=1 Tax=Actinopolymorpha sp. NPDC004070 TaxID=3154548 RepID=UPI0033BEFC44
MEGSPDHRPVHRETRFDADVTRYAARAKGMVASEIRALFSVANRPEVVSLAGGSPNISGLPLDVVGSLLNELVVDHGAVAMQYSPAQGDPRLREQITDVMSEVGIDANPDDVVVTVGSQQALDLVTRIFCDPGDTVVCEAPSYVGALGVFAAYQCDVVHVEMDDQGLVPEHLDNALTSLAAQGRRVKLLYTIPSYHNPMGVSLSADRRQRVLEICHRHDVLVVEDDPYGLLGFEGEPYRALRADDPARVVYLGSFSKTFAPGFRVGWALAPHAIRDKLVLAQESATLCPPTFSQYAVATYLANHDWKGQIKSFREMYRERRDAMLESLADLMPATTTWTTPRGGFFVWVTLPEGIDAKAMSPRAVTSRVAYVPGTAFYADGFGSQNMRLSYCLPPPERIREGVRRLAAVVERELDLRETFGPVRGGRDGGIEFPGPEVH